MMRPSARIWVAVHASSGIAAGVKATVTSAVALISPVSGRFGPSGSLASILIVVPFLSLKEYGRTRKRPSCVDHVQEYLRTFDLKARFCYKTTGPGNTSPWRKSGIGHGRNRHCPHDG